MGGACRVPISRLFVPAPRGGREVTARGPTAIVVDDDEHIREILRRLLPSAGVEIVAELTSGEEAVAWMADNNAALVIMDIGMAGMGGSEATRRIKESHPEVLIFGFTGWGSADAAEMLRAGASAVFEKTKLPDLLAAINDALESS